MGRRVLLTALGTRPNPTRYRLGDREDVEPAAVCPIAVVRLVEGERRPTHVYAIVTPAAREQSFRALQEGLEAIDPAIVVLPIDVPDLGDGSGLGGMLELIAAVFEPKDKLTLDVTHGLRHMPFLMYALSLYVTVLRDVELDAAYYGALEGGADASAAKPILDLGPLLELPRWFQAVEVFRDSGNASRIAKLVRERHRRRIEGREHPLAVANLADLLSRGSTALASGRPIEAGMEAAGAVVQIESGKLADALHDVPLAERLGSLIKEHLESIAVDRRVAKVKSDLSLDSAELDRQLRVITILLESGDVSGAAGNLREWIVSWMLWRSNPEGPLQAKAWLSKDARFQTEKRLGRLSDGLKRPATRDGYDENQRRFAEIWDKCLTVRNGLAHCGMGPNTVSPESNKKDADELLQFATAVLASPPPVPADLVPES